MAKKQALMQGAQKIQGRARRESHSQGRGAMTGRVLAFLSAGLCVLPSVQAERGCPTDRTSCTPAVCAQSRRTATGHCDWPLRLATEVSLTPYSTGNYI